MDKYCREGYTVGGIRITGEHFSYLNFARIRIKVGEGKNARKYDAFPRFLDMDYYYYHELELAKENRQGMIVAKSRRKGFSFKGAWNCVYEYNWHRESFSIIAAFMGDYSRQTMTMALNMINFLNKHTDWAKRKLIDTRDHIKSGFKETVNEVLVESGYQSEIMTMSFKDNPFKSIGKSASIMLFEEAGKWPGLIDAYMLSKPLFSDGDVMIGIPIIYGTGGDMEGGTQDFAEMFYNPTAYNLRAYENIWDENAVGECGWFVPDNWYKLPYVDDLGNSDLKMAESSLEKQRDAIRKSGTKRALQLHITQQPLRPAEAFLRVTGNMFPTADLLALLGQIKASNRIKNYDYIGQLIIESDTNKIKWVPDAKLVPILEYPIKKECDTDGCIVIYQMPYEDEMGNVPYGRYLAGLDPYQQEQSAESSSLGSTLIYDRLTCRVVAEYTGRPSTTKEYYENVRRLLHFFNAICLYENQIKGPFDFFESKNELYMLADQPALIKDIVKDSKVERGKGMHMTPQLKEYGEELIKSWLLEPYEGEQVLNLHKLRCIPLIEELISYNSEGNFDRVIAFMMCLYQAQELRKQKLDGQTVVKDVLQSPFWTKKLFAKNKRFGF